MGRPWGKYPFLLLIFARHVQRKQIKNDKIMFGLNEISWKEFILFVLIAIVLWYVLLLLWAWFKNNNQPSVLYEEYSIVSQLGSEGTKPIAVSATSFPSKLISSISESTIPLEVSFYEEIYPDDGIHIDYLLNETTGELEKLLHGIQYQQ